MFNIKNFSLLLVLSIVLVNYCENTKLEYNYKHLEGYYIGDAVQLNSGNLKNDTIFITGFPSAKLISIYRRFDGNFIMKIESLKDKKIGKYINI